MQLQPMLDELRSGAAADLGAGARRRYLRRQLRPRVSARDEGSADASRVAQAPARRRRRLPQPMQVDRLDRQARGRRQVRLRIAFARVPPADSTAGHGAAVLEVEADAVILALGRRQLAEAWLRWRVGPMACRTRRRRCAAGAVQLRLRLRLERAFLAAAGRARRSSRSRSRWPGRRAAMAPTTMRSGRAAMLPRRIRGHRDRRGRKRRLPARCAGARPHRRGRHRHPPRRSPARPAARPGSGSGSSGRAARCRWQTTCAAASASKA